MEKRGRVFELLMAIESHNMYLIFAFGAFQRKQPKWKLKNVFQEGPAPQRLKRFYTFWDRAHRKEYRKYVLIEKISIFFIFRS